MHHTLRCFLLAGCLGGVLQLSEAQTAISLEEVRQAGLKVIHITTVNQEEPRGELIANPNDPNSQNITSANKVGCRIVITLGTDTLYDSGPYAKEVSGATIRMNGNTTAYFSNPLNLPYKLKLEKKADLLTRGDNDRYKDKNWRLLKDATSLNTIVGLKLSQLIGMEWTPSYTPCNVVINGDYRGCYLLMETVRRNPRCRIDCDKQTGYILERDPYWWKEDRWFGSNWYDGNSMYRWTWKYPDEDAVSTDAEKYIQNYIIQTELSLADSSYHRYIDVPSFARWLIAHDILGTRDSGGANMYLKKYDASDTTLLQMPCLWDFDSNYALEPGTFSRLHTSSNAYFSKLLSSHNRTFARAYVSLWNEFKDSLLNSITAFVSHYPATAEGVSLHASRLLNNRRWSVNGNTVQADKQLVLQWFQKHIPLLDAQIRLIDIGPSSIIPVSGRQKPSVTGSYTPGGIKIARPINRRLTVVKYSDGTTRKLTANH